jgi:hypothetical protein
MQEISAAGTSDQLTQQSAALVERSSAAAESLKGQAHRLAEAVGVFKATRARNGIEQFIRRISHFQGPQGQAVRRGAAAAYPLNTSQHAQAGKGGSHQRRSRRDGPWRRWRQSTRGPHEASLAAKSSKGTRWRPFAQANPAARPPALTRTRLNADD